MAPADVNEIILKLGDGKSVGGYFRLKERKISRNYDLMTHWAS